MADEFIEESGTQKIQLFMRRKAMRFLVNLSTSGKYSGSKTFGASDHLMRYVLMNFICIFGGAILVFFAVENIAVERYLSSATCVCMAFACLAAIVLARTNARQVFLSAMLIVFYGLLCIMITYKGEAHGANFLFIYIYPSLAIMLLGMRLGMAFSLGLAAVISAEMFLSSLSYFKYQFDFSIRMLASYLLVVSIMAVIEITRKTKDWMIENQTKKLGLLNGELLRANEKLTSLSTTDELTGLNNRRSFTNYMEIIWKQSHRLNLPITVLMIDIDCFKKYNDTLGHLEGDKALIAIAQCMKGQLKRETDFVARYGGEEFVCLIPYIENAESANFANKLVKTVENMHIPHPASEFSEFVTISAGMASAVPDDNNTWQQLLGEADKALYEAKKSGRNRVCAAHFA